MPTNPRAPIPDSPPVAGGLADLLANPGQWMLLARRGRAAGGEQLPPWEYPGMEGFDWSEVVAERKKLLDAADAWRVFLPQRAVGAEGWEWLGIAIPEHLRPLAGVRNSKPKGRH